eukprot:COSAG01_NODE_782_length_13631_cov_73.763450_18_plen_123_part_00
MSRLFLSRNIEEGGHGRGAGCRGGEEKDGCRTPGNCSSGACEPCPETAGSDCSRCANPPSAADSFPAPNFPGYNGKLAVYDQVKVPQLPPGKYVVGFRYRLRVMIGTAIEINPGLTENCLCF